MDENVFLWNPSKSALDYDDDELILVSNLLGISL